mmetsp:Transcript_16308/g.19842  ORF Transcript_16308/g.19842 Transcript_16308/m.19842 type:complete len:87 (-) Transcript_16308:486-746(-)
MRRRQPKPQTSRLGFALVLEGRHSNFNVHEVNFNNCVDILDFFCVGGLSNGIEIGGEQHGGRGRWGYEYQADPGCKGRYGKTKRFG